MYEQGYVNKTIVHNGTKVVILKQYSPTRAYVRLPNLFCKWITLKNK